MSNDNKDDPEPPSEEFTRAFDSRTNGCSRECDCGRVHFDTTDNGWTWEEGELERLIKLSEEQPKLYVPSDGGVGSYCVAGREFVWGCPCNGGSRYERFLIDHGEQIAKFFNARAAKLRAEADKTEIKIPCKPEGEG